MARAAAAGLSISRTHMFKTACAGAIQASIVPSGETWGSMRSGLPNSTARGISAGKSREAADAESRKIANSSGSLFIAKSNVLKNHLGAQH